MITVYYKIVVLFIIIKYEYYVKIILQKVNILIKRNVALQENILRYCVRDDHIIVCRIVSIGNTTIFLWFNSEFS